MRRFYFMSEALTGLDTLAEQNKVMPDYFGYYTREVAELFSQDDDFLPFSSQTRQTSDLAGRTHGAVRGKDITKHNYNGKEGNSFVDSGSLFGDALGDGLSDTVKERLKALLRQSVVALTGEVYEMLDPVIAIRRIQFYLRHKKSSPSNLGATFEGDAAEHPQKKLKPSSSLCSVSVPRNVSPISRSLSGEGKGNEFMEVALPGKGISNSVKKQCNNCHTMKTPQWRSGPDGSKSLCNACGLKFRKGILSLPINDQKREPFLGASIGDAKGNGEVNDDLQFLLENDDSKVVETMKKYSDELYTKLEHMEQKLEELLDTVISNCRSMNGAEKLQLRKLIQNLPPRNLDRVVEIIKRGEPSEKYSCDEIHVELEDEDNATLWRLYYYVETVENARELSGLPCK